MQREFIVLLVEYNDRIPLSAISLLLIGATNLEVEVMLIIEVCDMMID